jgi:hypothetical protein
MTQLSVVRPAAAPASPELRDAAIASCDAAADLARSLGKILRADARARTPLMKASIEHIRTCRELHETLLQILEPDGE